MDSFNIIQLDNLHLKETYDFLQRNEDLRHGYFYPHPFSMEYLIYLILNKTKDFYCIGLDGDKVVAYGLLRGWEEGYDVPSLGVAVDKNYRGMGIGKFMCLYMQFIAKLRGCRKVRLRVIKGNDKAKELYEKLGYKFHEFDEEHLEGILEL